MEDARPPQPRGVPSPAGSPPPGVRTRIRRQAERGRYDRASIDAILDEGFVCHVAFVDERGPTIIPTAYGRDGNYLYFHGALANAAFRGISTALPVCVSVTLLDGLVLARSAFHHSVNYRSVVIFGAGEEVRDAEEKRKALSIIVEHIVPGRTADARPPSPTEVRSTRVVRLALDEASAKVRTGGPNDDQSDLDLPVWAGVMTLHFVAGTPVPARMIEGAPRCPEYVERYTRCSL